MLTNVKTENSISNLNFPLLFVVPWISVIGGRYAAYPIIGQWEPQAEPLPLTGAESIRKKVLL